MAEIVQHALSGRRRSGRGFATIPMQSSISKTLRVLFSIMVRALRCSSLVSERSIDERKAKLRYRARGTWILGAALVFAMRCLNTTCKGDALAASPHWRVSICVVALDVFYTPHDEGV